MRLKNKVVVITGASSGIGKALAIACAHEGARLAINGRNPQNLAETEVLLKQLGAEVLALPGDVSAEADCKALIDETVARFGRIDVLVNNAGMSMRALFGKADLSVIRKLMDINFWGTAYCSHYAMPHLLKSRGSLVGISSIAGMKGLPARPGYSASKFAMQGLLESIRIENLKKGLHVLICCPGFTASNIRNTALAADGNAQGESPRAEDKMMTAEEVAEHIIRGILKRKATIILTTQGKLTVWLNKFFPRWMDQQVYKHLAKEPDSPLKE